MLSIAELHTQIQKKLMDLGLTEAEVTKLAEAGKTEEQKLHVLQEAELDIRSRSKTHRIVRKNGKLGLVRESGTQKLIEVLTRNGFRGEELRILAGLDSLPFTEAELKEIPEGRERLYESLRQSYGHKEALLMMD